MRGKDKVTNRCVWACVGVREGVNVRGCACGCSCVCECVGVHKSEREQERNGASQRQLGLTKPLKNVEGKQLKVFFAAAAAKLNP